MKFVPVTVQQHGCHSWRRFTNYSFCAAEMVVPIAAAELSRVAGRMPLAFLSTSLGFELVALLSIIPRRNLFIGADKRWLSKYVPAFFRAYPFAAMRSSPNSDPILCVDEDSNLVTKDESGECLFDPDGSLSPEVQRIGEFLLEVEKSRAVANNAVRALATAGAIKPFAINVKVGGQARAIENLHCVDEEVLNKLPNEAFLRLRQENAIAVAHAQLMSMENIETLEDLANAQKSSSIPASSLPDTLDEIFRAAQNETLKFN
jgi:hypothetical protein